MRAIDLYYSSINIFRCDFNGSGTPGNGGAIYAVDSNITIIASIFNRNNAFNNGGAISAHGSFVTLKETLFVHNLAKRHGGAVFCDHTTINIISGNHIPKENLVLMMYTSALNLTSLGAMFF